MPNSSHSSARCKPGDRALVLGGPNAGAIVHVDRRAVHGERNAGLISVIGSATCWRVTSLGGPLKMINAVTNEVHCLRQSALMADSNLWPLHDQEGEDETLTWAGKPSTMPVADLATPENWAALQRLPFEEQAKARVWFEMHQRYPDSPSTRQFLAEFLAAVPATTQGK